MGVEEDAIASLELYRREVPMLDARGTRLATLTAPMARGAEAWRSARADRLKLVLIMDMVVKYTGEKGKVQKSLRSIAYGMHAMNYSLPNPASSTRLLNTLSLCNNASGVSYSATLPSLITST